MEERVSACTGVALNSIILFKIRNTFPSTKGVKQQIEAPCSFLKRGTREGKKKILSAFTSHVMCVLITDLGSLCL